MTLPPLPRPSIHPYHLTIQPPKSIPPPNPNDRNPQSSHRPAKITNIAPKTGPIRPIYPHVPPHRPTQMNGNERKSSGYPKIAAIRPENIDNDDVGKADGSAEYHDNYL